MLNVKMLASWKLHKYAHKYGKYFLCQVLCKIFRCFTEIAMFHEMNKYAEFWYINAV